MRKGRAALAAGLLAALSSAGISGCGWTPLYADLAQGPTDEELRAIQVAPIPERIGQRLAMALRNSLNPTGEPTKQRYRLATTLSVSLSNLGIQTQGTATLGRLDVYATYYLTEISSGSSLQANTIHVQNSFDLNPNQYSTVVGEDDAAVRSVAELNQEIVTRLSLFMAHRAAASKRKPTEKS
jgi:LPS-assembly lipoprotein